MKKTSKDVQSGLFQQESDFFNPLDRGQIKYEMLRSHSLEGHFIKRNRGRWHFVTIFVLIPTIFYPCQALFCRALRTAMH